MCAYIQKKMLKDIIPKLNKVVIILGKKKVAEWSF